MKTILSFFAGVITFSLLDYIWLAHIAKKFYLDRLASLVNIKDGSLVVNYFGAVMFYITAIVSVYLFVVKTSVSSIQALYMGAVFGFLMYGFYDFTNYATLRNWSLQLSIIDMLWGAFLVSMVSFVMYSVRNM